jgi:phosphoribosylaminoimidazolecarboxamide formyltransferase/IMP cyclohydrolase
MEQLQGKELSYNNIRDLDLAWKTVAAFGFPLWGIEALGAEEARSLVGAGTKRTTENESICCVAVKHNTPCGVALGSNLLEAYNRAYACDPVSIFGGIVACNTEVDEATAGKLGELFLEIIVAPSFSPPALEILKKKKNLRLLKATLPPKGTMEYIGVDGGLLVQTTDQKLLEKWEVVTRTVPPAEDLEDLLFGLRVVTYVKSNAIVVVKHRSAIGIGGGQTNRIWAAEQALERASLNIKAAKKDRLPILNDGEGPRVLASDAFFPFSDVVEAAARSGIRSIIQPGGSIRDKESIEACNRHGIAMVFTGLRHFRH